MTAIQGLKQIEHHKHTVCCQHVGYINHFSSGCYRQACPQCACTAALICSSATVMDNQVELCTGSLMHLVFKTQTGCLHKVQGEGSRGNLPVGSLPK